MSLTCIQKRRRKAKRLGLCAQCKNKNKKAEYGTKCYVCTLKGYAYRVFGDIARWNEIELLFKQSKFKCCYSGERLKLGRNISIDHKIPRRRGGSDELNNLVVCSTQVNIMKGDLTIKEFKEKVKQLYKNMDRW